ncbi:hypothetical protein GGR67_003509 [Xanthomonas arboricola]|nr:hypothetical protein [Xanthomonas euroxanthea]
MELRQTPYAHTAEAWTFGDLLRRFVQEIDDGLIKHASVRTDHSNAHLFLGGGKGLGLSQTGMPHLTRKLAKDLTQDDFLGCHASSYTRLKKLLAEQVFENDIIKDALRKKW